MNNKKIIDAIAAEVRKSLENENSGHDWWHVYRVWRMAQYLSKQESADMFVIELAALLHDIADWKFHDGDDTVGSKIARQLLVKYDVSKNVIAHVCDIIATTSFKGAGVKTEMKTIEGGVVQDADRLDAIGAIGIGRAFAYGGHKNRLMYDPSVKPVLHQSKDEYYRNENSTINHFYEKLLLLKDRMNTGAAKKIAEERHRFMEVYLDRFFQEWEGKI
jgi:uncharacterized protein